MSWATQLAGYQGTRVLVTGNTGFKGTWITSWLVDLGAEVTGFSLPSESDETNISGATDIATRITQIDGDIRNASAVAAAFDESQPDLVIHMAAQSLVRVSYETPLDTFTTNIIGTAHVLEAARAYRSVRAVVSVASDKCYENAEDGKAYAEDDHLGGADPYSASKGAAEIVTSSYRRSFFDDASGKLIASVRAGNVLGAGDMSENRVIPDLMRAVASNTTMVLRNPDSVRPWQHVLEPLRAYLMLGIALLDGDRTKAGSWNIGPSDAPNVTVKQMVERVVQHWGVQIHLEFGNPDGPREAALLMLDVSKARNELGFVPDLTLDDTARYVAEGYRAALDGEPLGSIIRRQTAAYTELA